MKKLVKGMIALTMMGALFGCSTSKKEQTTLTVFAAASMTESLDKVIAA